MPLLVDDDRWPGRSFCFWTCRRRSNQPVPSFVADPLLILRTRLIPTQGLFHSEWWKAPVPYRSEIEGELDG